MSRKLTKSKNNIVVSGALGGIGEYLRIDPTIIRVIYIIMTFMSAGVPFVLYFLLMLVIPSSSSSENYQDYGRTKNPYQGFHRYKNNQEFNSEKKVKPRKEAEKVEEDDWSDF